LAEQRSPKP